MSFKFCLKSTLKIQKKNCHVVKKKYKSGSLLLVNGTSYHI